MKITQKLKALLLVMVEEKQKDIENLRNPENPENLRNLRNPENPENPENLRNKKYLHNFIFFIQI
jgi:hypothetical protein